jgi:hypothetical protein
MAVAGRDDPLGAHGALVILAALAGIFFAKQRTAVPFHENARSLVVFQKYQKPTRYGGCRRASAIAGGHARGEH